MRSNIGWGRLALLCTRSVEASPGYDFAGNVMHVDTDAICPRCFGWIAPDDIVRRTAYGLVQHEACWLTDQPTCLSELSG